MNKNNKLVYLGIGIILGIFICQISFLQFGVNGLWSLTIFGICILILGLIHVYGKSEKIPTKQEDSEGKEKKSLLSKAKEVWNK